MISRQGSQAAASGALAQLEIPDQVRADVARFLAELVELRPDDLASVTAFGSAVTGDYRERTSDVNLLVVYSDLDLGDLHAVSRLARRWLRRRRFGPRFLSRRNLESAARYFPIDFMEMRDAHVVLHGEDLLPRLQFPREALVWQLAHEVKGMRMRVKQQFWRAAGQPRAMRLVVRQRFSSLVRLLRVLLVVEGRTAPARHTEIVEAALGAYGIDREVVRLLSELRAGRSRPRGAALLQAFEALMQLIRAVDAQVDRVGA